MNLSVRFCSACSKGVFFKSQNVIWPSDKAPPALPTTVTANSALDSVCQEHLPARDTWMGGNIMLIAHTPRFIVVKNALASK